eukprot:366557-Chlamydomonas_euryale.AAC.13
MSQRKRPPAPLDILGRLSTSATECARDSVIRLRGTPGETLDQRYRMSRNVFTSASSNRHAAVSTPRSTRASARGAVLAAVATASSTTAAISSGRKTQTRSVVRSDPQVMAASAPPAAPPASPHTPIRGCSTASGRLASSSACICRVGTDGRRPRTAWWTRSAATRPTATPAGKHARVCGSQRAREWDAPAFGSVPQPTRPTKIDRLVQTLGICKIPRKQNVNRFRNGLMDWIKQGLLISTDLKGVSGCQAGMQAVLPT